MIADLMPARRGTEENQEPKVTLCGRIKPDVAEAFEEIAQSMRPVPTTSQLMALAIEEFVERNQKSSVGK